MFRSTDFRQLVLASAIGNALEHYDFVIYGYFAAIFLSQFFPEGDLLSGLLMSYGVFATGFVMRPLGGLVLGHIGDRWGRKRVLELSLGLMFLPTLGIALLPTYASIGLLAPILLVFFRMMQGFSLGGEIIGSYCFLGEHAPEGQRGLTIACGAMGFTFGKLLGGSVFFLGTYLMGEDVLAAWGWRIPFFVGVGIGAVGYWMRRRIAETPVFLQLKQQHRPARMPILEALSQHKRAMLQLVLATMPATMAGYLLFVFMPVYLKTQWDLPYSWTIGGNMTISVSSMITLPFVGWLVDRYGSLPFLCLGSFIYTLAAVPLFHLLPTASYWVFMGSHVLIGLSFCLIYGPLATLFLECFPASVRSSACGLAYNTAVMLFGGLTPFLATYLMKVSGDVHSPGYLLSAGAFLGFVNYCWMAWELRSEADEAQVAAEPLLA